MNGKVIAICSQKGGVAKTTTCVNLSAGLVKLGKKVLVIDVDPQGSLSICLGIAQPDELKITTASLLNKILNDAQINEKEGILTHSEGMDFVPANLDLSGLDLALVSAMSRETILKQYVEIVRSSYDYIILDCSPSLGMLTLNALAAADSVIIPVQAQYLSIKGMEQLLQTISKVRKQINPTLTIDGILLTMVDERTNYAKEIISLLNETYGKSLKIFKSKIPLSVRASEASAAGKSIFAHSPSSKVCEAYAGLIKEVLKNGH